MKASRLRQIFRMSCRESTVLMSKSLDTELPFSERLGLQIHFLICRFCRRYRKQLQMVHTISRLLPDAIQRELEHEESGKLSDEARERIKKSLQTDDPE